jgi:hypothetical protein
MEESENIEDVEVHIELKSLIMVSSGIFLNTINKVRFI